MTFAKCVEEHEIRIEYLKCKHIKYLKTQSNNCICKM